MPRTLQPELLDSLPPEHPDARHNRRDLRITNRVLGTHRWLARTLPTLLRNGDRVLEIGAGTGEFALQLQHAGLAVDGLDLWPQPAGWPQTRLWHREDLRSFPRYGDYDAVLGNLIFHQFSQEELAALGAAFQHVRIRAIVACEPARRPLSQFLYRALGPLFGANEVSLHDAHVSIAAGFVGDELARALHLSPSAWTIRTSTTWLGINRLVATRRA